MEEQKSSAAQTRVRFVTKHSKYQVPTTPFSVPQRINRLGLNEIVNHLLSNATPVQFEFLVGGQLLRASLKKSLKQQGLSEETVIDIEYFPAAEKPNPKGSLQLPDWVGGIAFHGEHVISACYDGSLHAAAVSDLLEGDTAKDVWVAPAHKKAIVALHGTQDGRLITGSHDYHASIWALAEEGSTAPSHVASLQTASPVQSVLLCTADNLAVVGTWNGNTYVWQPNVEGEEDVDMEEGATRASKRQKPSASDASSQQVVFSYKDALYDLGEHKQAVSTICSLGSEKATSKVATGSWDHSIKLWDIDRAGSPSTRTLVSNKVVTSLASNHGSLIASGHPDHIVRLWDTRQSTSNAAQVFKGIGSWISAIDWNAGSENNFTTASHDGKLALWDIRGKECLDTFTAHEDKALCLRIDSVSGNTASGGADSKVKLFAPKQ